MRIEIEHGAIIADDEGGLWRVLEAVSYTHLDVYKRQARCNGYVIHAISSIIRSI